jgi:hypothetical protein
MAIKRPRFLQSKAKAKSAITNMGKGLVHETLTSGMKSIIKAQPKDIKAKQMPNYIRVTQERMDKMGVIDLKPIFERSGAKKPSKDGGWYAVIPIRRTKRSMSRRGYEQLRAIEVDPGESRTVISDYLYDRRRSSDATMLNYEPKSKNITKTMGANGRSTYVAFRTVSSKSPANSWIVNRDKVNEKDTSKTFVRNVDQVMKWKMRNM